MPTPSQTKCREQWCAPRKEEEKNATPSLARKKIWHALCGSREQQSVESQVQHTSDCETTNWSCGSKKGHSSIRRPRWHVPLVSGASLHTRVMPSVHETAEALPTQSVLSPSSGGGNWARQRVVHVCTARGRVCLSLTL